jgi:hypothetical protein
MNSNNLANKRIGEIRKNTSGSLMKIVKYNRCDDIWVQFEQGKPIHAQYSNFVLGNIKNPYDKDVYGVGYLGEGEYKTRIKGIVTNHYKMWFPMMVRCYSDKYKTKQPSYTNVFASEEWHNFQTFSKWIDANYYEIEGERMCLDKDILIKGNKIYSPDTCLIVPIKINNLFIKSASRRGNLPIGVEKDEYGFRAAMCKQGKRNSFGHFKTPEEAFLTYKIQKEQHIKEIADQYKDKIPKKIYDALYSYKVEITD